MKKAITAAVALSMMGSAAFAGGPVVIVEEAEPVVVTERPSTSGGILVPLLIGAAVLCAVACGSDS